MAKSTNDKSKGEKEYQEALSGTQPGSLKRLSVVLSRSRYLGTTMGYSGKDPAGIFTVTSFCHSGDKKRADDQRCWGWYPTLPEAKKAVSMNAGDMHECSYNYCLIELVPCGIPPIAKQVKWYVWIRAHGDKDNFLGRWMACKAPAWSKGTINYSLG